MSLAIYDNHAGNYSDYANNGSNLSDLLKPPETNGRFASGDAFTWQRLKATTRSIEIDKHVRILDIGCGDGVWSMRIAHWLANSGHSVEVLLTDISLPMLSRARELINQYAIDYPSQKIQFKIIEYDLREPSCESIYSREWDIVLCLHTVLNHLIGKDRQIALDQLCSIRSRCCAISVKPPYGPPTLFSIPMTDVIYSRQYENELLALDRNGDLHSIPKSPITCQMLIQALKDRGLESQPYALGVFSSRFSIPESSEDELNARITGKLRELDELSATDFDLMNYANHLLVIAKPTTQ